MKEFAPLDNSEFNLAFENRSVRKMSNTRIQFWSRKVKLLVGFSIILALLFLATLFSLIFINSTKILRPTKIKRSLKMSDCGNESESTETAQNDIHIIPEGRAENLVRRANLHPNHRYPEIGPKSNIYKMMKHLYDESGWSPKPFRVNKPKGTNTGSYFRNFKSLDNSMRFKGVFTYVSPEDNLTNNLSTENLYHSKEINNLMQNYFDNEGKENTAVKKAFKSHGAPIQVHDKGVPRRERLNLHQSSSSKPKQSWFNERFEKKPLTILIDIYPMTKASDYFKNGEHKLKHVTPPLRNEFSKARAIHSTGKFSFPRESKNGMIMKLNLYAKERKFSRHQNSIGKTEDSKYLKYGKKAEEKTFGWFSEKKEKKQEPKQCSLMALKPDAKHVTAKWKSENGEWIHANHLLVKYLKNE